MTDHRPPYRAAAIAAVAVLAVYLVTLAPTVTFWDAGEFIAAARTLGIPHPPGTPLFVLMAHVWGVIFPIGSYAWRQNLLSAILAATAAGCWFLVANDAVVRQHSDVDSESRRAFGIGTGAAAAALTAFGFTTWQNATETEVYSAAMCTIALAAWLTLRWRATRDESRSARLLLVILFLGAISVAIHLMALLVGPAVIMAMMLELRANPHAERARRQQDWARLWLLGAAWLLLIAIGLGSGSLTIITLVLALAAAGLAVRRRQMAFVIVAFAIVAIGVSPYLFLLLRARQGPWLNEANPATWHALLDVIRRAQYPVRTPLDDPTVFHGAGNPGRSITILGYQLANYGQYFDWQWARSIGAPWRASPWRLLITLLMATVGVHGAFAQKSGDRTSFALVAGLFAITGIGLVLYMNFKPGPAIGWEHWSDLAQHEVRDRDYFFVGSFVAWGI
ncbi:MAG TPA: DUF2723 domain-containing protein, partial [Gemmatimonadales bacterium]|nr:DUF2723 domain-containing protein [Gemmatimonadales bacterium]